MDIDLVKIPLEVFQRHVLVTHLKGNAACVVDQLEGLANRSGDRFGTLLTELLASCYPKNPEWLEDEWHRTEVPLDDCHFAHKDFRHHAVPEGERFVDFLNGNRQRIDSGCFPFSYEICHPWEGEMLEPLVRERNPGKYYVLDGQLRIIWHWYHNTPKIKVFMYKGQIPI